MDALPEVLDAPSYIPRIAGHLAVYIAPIQAHLARYQMCTLPPALSANRAQLQLQNLVAPLTDFYESLENLLWFHIGTWFR
jgi:hypothetical protein